MRHAEAAEQAAFVTWCRLTPGAATIFAIANGGKRRLLEAVRLRNEGVLPGVPDLMLPVACGGAHGLFVEMKSATGTLSAEQSKRLSELAASGYVAAACWSAVDAIALTKQYLAHELPAGLYGSRPKLVKPRQPRGAAKAGRP